MTLLERGTAVDGLSKIAGFYEERPSRTLQSVALSSLVKSASAEELRINNRIGAALLQKQAWTWGGVWDSTVNAAKNIGSYAASAGNGLMSGAIGAVRGIGGAVGAAGNGIATLWNGKGLMQNLSEGWDSGSDVVDNIGIGDYDLGHARRRIATWQANNIGDFIDRNNLSADSWAVKGMNLTNAVGDFAGGAIVGGGLGKGLQLAGRGMQLVNSGNRIARTAAHVVGKGTELGGKAINMVYGGGPKPANAAAAPAGKLSKVMKGVRVGGMTAGALMDASASQQATEERERNIRTGFGANEAPKINDVDFGGYYTGTI